MKYLIIMILSAGLAVSTLTVNASYFTDMSGHWADDYVAWAVYEIPLFSGYPDGSFRPDNSITRAEFMTMLNKIVSAVSDTHGESEDGFSYDDFSAHHWSYGNVTSLAHYLKDASQSTMNVSDVFTSRFLFPDRAITRQEAALLTNSLITPPIESVSRENWFRDLSYENEHHGIIMEVYASGIVSGYEDDTFRPDRPITRAEASVFAQRIHRDLLYLQDDLLTPLMPTDDSVPAYPSFDMPGNKSQYTLQDRLMDDAVATLEYLSIVGFIPFDERDLYDLTPVETMWELKNDNYSSVIANNYYLLTHDQNLGDERKKELAEEAFQAYREYQSTEVDHMLTFIQASEPYVSSQSLTHVLETFLQRSATERERTIATIMLAYAYVDQDNSEKALDLFPPLLENGESLDLLKVLIQNELVITLKSGETQNAIDLLHVRSRQLKNHPEYVFYENTINHFVTSIHKQLLIREQ